MIGYSLLLLQNFTLLSFTFYGSEEKYKHCVGESLLVSKGLYNLFTFPSLRSKVVFGFCCNWCVRIENIYAWDSSFYSRVSSCC